MSIDGFTQLVDDSNAFFTQLRRNNSKDWFDPRKDHYTTNIKKPAEFLGDVLAEDFSRIAGRTYTPKLFRIYRDVRFSKDKTPLKPYLHMLWQPAGDNPFAPAFFWGSEPGEMRVGFGFMSVQGPELARFRAFVDAWGDQLVETIAQTGMQWSDWGPAPLKRVPQPYDKDHPHAELLKKKGMIVSAVMDDGWRQADGGLVAALRARFEDAMPLARLLNDKLSAEG